MGAEDSEFKHKLQTRADRAQELDQQAAACLSSIHEVSSNHARPALAELEALVQEGQSIGVKMDSLTELAALVSAAKAWDQQAQFCLTGLEAQHAKHGKIQMPSLAQVTELLQQHSALAIAMPHAEALFEKQRQAVSWVDSAVKALEHRNLQQHLSDVQGIVDSGIALNLEMPELTQLDSLVRAIQWNAKVRGALGLTQAPVAAPLSGAGQTTANKEQTEALPTQPSGIQSSADGAEPVHMERSITEHPDVGAGNSSEIQGGAQQAQQAADQTAGGATAAPAGPAEPPAQHANSILDAPSNAGQAVLQPAVQPGSGPEPVDARQTQHQLPVQSAHETQHQMPVQSAHGNNTEQQQGWATWQEQVTLAEAEQLVEQGQQLPVEETLLHQLHTLMQIGQHWQVQASFQQLPS